MEANTFQEHLFLLTFIHLSSKQMFIWISTRRKILSDLIIMMEQWPVIPGLSQAYGREKLSNKLLESNAVCAVKSVCVSLHACVCIPTHTYTCIHTHTHTHNYTHTYTHVAMGTEQKQGLRSWMVSHKSDTKLHEKGLRPFSIPTYPGPGG